MATSREFVDCVLNNGFNRLITRQLTTNKDDLSKYVIEKLKDAQRGEMPIAYAARDLPNEAFKVLPEDVIPSEFEVITHLQLLSIFRALRYKISNTNGLFNIYNENHKNDMSKVFDQAFQSKKAQPFETRWKVYVARAVERYTVWFNSHPAEEFDRRPQFTGGIPWAIDLGTLPPIDVLLVWHVHMLHPRAYWEDCVRSNRQGFFRTMSFPWLAISHIITEEPDSHGNGSSYLYSPPVEAMKYFQAMTGHAYENIEDDIYKVVTCPNCRKKGIKADWWAAFHHGWAEEEFELYCPDCGTRITKDGLSALQFLDDFAQLSSKGVPMKGSLLDYLGVDQNEQNTYPGFANDLLGKAYKMTQLTLATGEGMETLRLKIKNLMNDKFTLSAKDFNVPFHRDNQYPLRRMMVRYYDNPSTFAVELNSAVARQSRFIDTMDALAYLKSPFRQAIIHRSIDRLLKFLHLLRMNPERSLSPPVDVDLAWHTFQLSPPAYTATCFVLLGTLIDHDDSTTTIALLESGRASDKLWRKNFPSDLLGYDGCTCAFCEAERQFTTTSNGATSSTSKRFMSKISTSETRKRAQKIDDFYGLACAAAANRGSKEVVRLKSSYIGGKDPGYPQHPYLAFRPRDDPDMNSGFKHSTSYDYNGAKCISLSSTNAAKMSAAPMFYNGPGAPFNGDPNGPGNSSATTV
ncbi:hypothetical protein V1512DRAFT_239619 [Lipomyces arxii]|uniref:uncharacterized protein n=1 Tax=Lipomyces arxii TaxID=56418 RepID=UPI0034CF90B6